MSDDADPPSCPAILNNAIRRRHVKQHRGSHGFDSHLSTQAALCRANESKVNSWLER